MKKFLFFVAIATLAIVSCQKEVDPSAKENVNSTKCFRASIEQLVNPVTSATINGSNELVWATGDKIGIYFDSWDDNKHQAFTLSGGEGTTEGEFTIDTGWAYNPADATVAFFPWQGTGSDKNNVWSNTMYFKLPSSYWSYDNGDMLTPLVASPSGSSAISFKHAGAAVKLTVNNLVSGTYAVKMSVYNKQITGGFHVNPANAGTDALTLDAAEDVSQNHVTLNSYKGSGAFSWIFPVPTIDDPKLKFEITDDNGVLVWKKSLAAQEDKDLGRGDILVMPALAITPYQQFSTDDTWSVCGDHNSWGDTRMVSDGKLYIAKSVTFAANNQFKIRTTGEWTTSYGYDQLNKTDGKDKWHKNAVAGTENNNIKITTAGTYDIIFNSSSDEYCGYAGHEIRVVQNGFPYPAVVVSTPSVSINIDGDMSDWASVSSGVTHGSNNYREFKATYDADNIYLYTKRVNVSGQRYIYYNFDLDNNSGTGTTCGSSTGLEAYMALVIYNSTTDIYESPGADAYYPSSSVYSNVVCKGSIGAEFTETEIKIPRTNLGVQNGDVIRIYSYGNKDATAFATTGVTLTIND